MALFVILGFKHHIDVCSYHLEKLLLKFVLDSLWYGMNFSLASVSVTVAPDGSFYGSLGADLQRFIKPKRAEAAMFTLDSTSSIFYFA